MRVLYGAPTPQTMTHLYLLHVAAKRNRVRIMLKDYQLKA